MLLEGACGSCPSSTTTMKHGIEKVLKENFVDFKSVSAVSDIADALGSELTVGKLASDFQLRDLTYDLSLAPNETPSADWNESCQNSAIMS